MYFMCAFCLKQSFEMRDLDFIFNMGLSTAVSVGNLNLLFMSGSTRLDKEE